MLTVCGCRHLRGLLGSTNFELVEFELDFISQPENMIIKPEKTVLGIHTCIDNYHSK